MTRVVNVRTQPELVTMLIDRSTKWGNPYSHKANTLAKYRVKTRAEAIIAYRKYITEGEGMWLLSFLYELEGQVLGCHCKPSDCHGDVLVDLIKNR